MLSVLKEVGLNERRMLEQCPAFGIMILSFMHHGTDLVGLAIL